MSAQQATMREQQATMREQETRLYQLMSAQQAMSRMLGMLDQPNPSLKNAAG